MNNLHHFIYIYIPYPSNKHLLLNQKIDNMATKNILLVALVLVLSLTTRRTSAQTGNETLMTRPGCPYRCNNATIPYPFGIGPNCYRDASFEIDCNNSSGKLTPYVNGTVLEVLEITVSNGQIRAE